MEIPINSSPGLAPGAAPAPERQAPAAGGDLQVVAFRLGSERYAVDILAVQEINRVTGITRVPRAAAGIQGVINLRGTIVPILNLHRRFGMPDPELGEETRIIVFEHQDTRAGFIVDEVSDVMRLARADIEDTGGAYGMTHSDAVWGVGKVDGCLLVLLDPGRLLEAAPDAAGPAAEARP